MADRHLVNSAPPRTPHLESVRVSLEGSAVVPDRRCRLADWASSSPPPSRSRLGPCSRSRAPRRWPTQRRRCSATGVRHRRTRLDQAHLGLEARLPPGSTSRAEPLTRLGPCVPPQRPDPDQDQAHQDTRPKDSNRTLGGHPVLSARHLASLMNHPCRARHESPCRLRCCMWSTHLIVRPLAFDAVVPVMEARPAPTLI